MKILFKSLFLSIICFCNIAVAHNDNDKNKDSLKVSFVDNLIAASFDSALLVNYSYTEELFNEELFFNLSEIPEFTDSIYDLRIKALDAKTPIDLVYNPLVKKRINEEIWSNRKIALTFIF